MSETTPDYREYCHEYPVKGSGAWRVEVRWWDKPNRTTRRIYLATRDTEQEAQEVARVFIATGVRPAITKRGPRGNNRPHTGYVARVAVNEYPSVGTGVWRAQIRKYCPIAKKVIRIYVGQRNSQAEAYEIGKLALAGGTVEQAPKGPRVGYVRTTPRKAPVFTKPRKARELNNKPVPQRNLRETEVSHVNKTANPDRIAMMKMVLSRLT